MNKIVGKISHKETGLGIPDLLVVIYDVDPDTRPEELLNEFNPSNGNTLSNAQLPLSFGDRITSEATDAEGRFVCEYRDEEFRVRNESEKRPDLLLMVLAPEETGQAPNSRILHISLAIRQNAARKETYLIKLNSRQLESAGIPIPKEPGEGDTPPILVNRLKTFEEQRMQLEGGINELAKNRVENTRVKLEVFHSDFKPALRKSLSHLPDNERLNDRVVSSDKEVLEKNTSAMKDGINKFFKTDDNAAENGDGSESLLESRPPVRSFINLTDKQKDILQRIAETNGDGIIEGDQLDRVLHGEDSTPLNNVLMVRENPLLKFCREMTSHEKKCLKLLDNSQESESDSGEDSNEDNNTEIEGSLNENEGTNNGSENNEPSNSVNEPLTGDELIQFYTSRLLETATTPETEVSGGLTPISNDEKVRDQIKRLSLEKSPADMPAYYDFHNLQLAFEHVWQEAIDEGILNLAEDAYDLIVELGGNPQNQNSGSDPVRALLNEGKLVMKSRTFDFKTVSTNGAVSSGTNSTIMARSLPFDVNDVWAGVREGKMEWKDHLPPRQNNQLPQILAQLEQRLKENYNFTVFAANQKERSINFGLLVTYRQKWTPEAYQAGELVKTITLAPKQTQKITVTKKEHKKRYQKEVENNLRSWHEESSKTSRAEEEIVRRASIKTNFNLSTQHTFSTKVPLIGGTDNTITTAYGREANKSSDDIKKSFHEAVFKSSQDYKNEHTMEVTSEETVDYETVETSEITNPNDEIAVTFLFYELQRRYRIIESIHQLMPVILVAQEMPKPHEIDGDWLLTYDWILRRVILDDSFLPVFDYLTENVAGDETTLAHLKSTVQAQQLKVENIKRQLAPYEEKLTLLKNTLIFVQNFSIDDLLQDKIDLLRSHPMYNQIKKEVEKQLNKNKQERIAALEQEIALIQERINEISAKAEAEISTLTSLTDSYIKVQSEHLNRQTAIARLRVHIKENILYYMQAIWSHEPPDQRFFRLHNTLVPTLKRVRKRFVIDFDEVSDSSLINQPHMRLKRFSASPMHTYSVEVKTPPSWELEKIPLSQIADLDNMLGFKGNYMIFALKESNALTDYMMEPYVDRAFNTLIDPDDAGNWSLEDFASYTCCLNKKLTSVEFEEIKEQLKKQYEKLLTASRRADNIITIPSGSLFIEALPAKHSLIEEFKARHRAIDVKKVQAEVRKLELENIRYAARILDDNLEDPDIEKKIVIESDANRVIVPTDN